MSEPTDTTKVPRNSIFLKYSPKSKAKTEFKSPIMPIIESKRNSNETLKNASL